MRDAGRGVWDGLGMRLRTREGAVEAVTGGWGVAAGAVCRNLRPTSRRCRPREVEAQSWSEQEPLRVRASAADAAVGVRRVCECVC